MRTITTLICLLMTFTAMAQEEALVTPQIAVRVPVGELATIEGVAVHFNEVVEDSRCPRNVTCVWEGRAIVSLSVGTVEELQEPMSVILGKAIREETTSKVFYETEQIQLMVVGLNPYPEAGVEQGPYVLLVKCVEKS